MKKENIKFISYKIPIPATCILDRNISSKELYLPISPKLELPNTISLASPSKTGIIVGHILHPNSFIELDKYILPSDPLHTLILGTTGSGKSNTLRVLAQEFSTYDNNIVILLDWHGEHYISGFARVRPSDAKVPMLGLEPKHIVLQIFNNIVYTIWGNELTPLMTKYCIRL